MATLSALNAYLDDLVEWYEQPSFIDNDPISIPHGFDNPRDQEVIGLYAALLAWGRRDVMLHKLNELCDRMDHAPYAFVRSFDKERDASALEGFVHRTFQSVDAVWLTHNLSTVLDRYGSVERLFAAHLPSSDEADRNDARVKAGLHGLSTNLLTVHDDTPRRLRKHLARPDAGSACKRLNMYLRWMVRSGPVDLGLWSCLDPSELMIPLDVHAARHVRALGLLERKSTDWTAVRRVTAICRDLCPDDPVRYDFAFYGVGAQDDSLDTRFTGENSVDASSLPTAR